MIMGNTKFCRKTLTASNIVSIYGVKDNEYLCDGGGLLWRSIFLVFVLDIIPSSGDYSVGGTAGTVYYWKLEVLSCFSQVMESCSRSLLTYTDKIVYRE